MEQILTFLETPSFWLPENTTWSDLENRNDGPYKDIQHPVMMHLLMVLPMIVILKLIRHTMEYFIFKPIGRSFNLKDRVHVKPEDIPLLRSVYRTVKTPSNEEMLSLSQQLDCDERKVQRWFRRRRNADKLDRMSKFCECGWTVVYLTTVNLFGISFLYKEDFVYDLEKIFIGYPHQHIKAPYFWYYVIELAHYISLVVFTSNDSKRKDGCEMLLHHGLTIGLFIYSWRVNLVRLGLVVLCLHEPVDYLLNAAKIFRYIKKQHLADYIFVVFFLVWIITRLVMYPYVLYIAWGQYDLYCPMTITFCLALTAIQFLHLVWSYMIGRVVHRALTKGSVEDVRSETESTDVEENGHVNGNANDKYLNGNANKKRD